ncbi:glycerol-3-phosphate responsive antiterminator [Anaerococcus lactolyticus ATCC 51172]|uniref:Glycerol-3-phosphate responsive antiterminator n=2 Tax=Anaerococcus lactolyticus TaxID=33032 RepID=C2BGZ2_9FIRM|nr:glycerol-3-phosphate responsive antiterminator [Anaerococcus lactolyticus ATCC 51172]
MRFGRDMLNIREILYENPVIMAIKDGKDLRECLKEEYIDNKVVFVLFGNIETIPTIVKKLKNKDKIVFVHENLVEGLSSSHYSPNFIKKYTDADGIITTRAQNIYEARRLGLSTVFRFFILDSLSYESIKETIKSTSADLFEVLPGIMPQIIGEIASWSQVPLIAGGLIRDKADAMGAIGAGAIGVSSSNTKIWKM